VGERIIGVEALVRWNHPTKGFIAPDQFIRIAEETGLILDLGERVLREACQVSLQWPELVVSVNLSPKQFHHSGFAGRAIAIVREIGADPCKIHLEVTEGILLDDNEVTQNGVKTLRRAGFKLVLDDFGTGHSGLGYLQRFEVDKIKIDQSFIQALERDGDGPAIVQAIIDLAHAMKLTVTAEGVETAAQKEFLFRAGCNEFQEFLFSQAVSKEKMDKLLASIG
jgi:EAL domain-containing protein (putative c-di-GMP-specific phosphodiesterase class I)